MSTIQILLSLATIVMSGVMSAIVTFRLNARRGEKEFRRQKLEQFYMAASGYCNRLGCNFFAYLPVMEQAITFNDALDIVNKAGKDEERRFEHANMLIAIYFPHFQAAFDEVLRCRDTLNGILGDFKRSYKNGNPDGSRWLRPYTEALASIDRLTEQLRKVVHEEARRLQ
jgi:hypothetical protein